MFRDRVSYCLNYLLNSSSLPSPCFVLDTERLLLNMELLDSVQQKTGVKILLALKGFAAWSVFPLLSRKETGPLWGICASSVDEALLGKEKFGGEVHAFSPAWTEEEIGELKNIADHVSFNSINQLNRFAPLLQSSPGQKAISAGLRVNPEYSESKFPMYDPCSPGSHMGVRASEMPASQDMKNLEGLHFHTLCEQDSSALANTLKVFENKFSPWFDNIRWFNFGGGHHITRDGYDIDLLCSTLNSFRKKYNRQIYLEPGEAIALDAGWLYATIIDIVQADMPVLILDTSAACHMPDVLEMPYTPDLWYKPFPDNQIQKAGKKEEYEFSCRIAGKSCLAGDIIGEYSFKSMPRSGDKLVFADMAIYSMVKTNTFNGIRLPSIAIHDFRNPDPFKVIRNFNYEDFKNRLS